MEERPRRTTFRTRLNTMVNTLRQDIVTGKHLVGDYLPSEMDLAKQFQLSKNSVRKGLDILVNEGLIVKKPRKGNMVVLPPSEKKVTVKFGYHYTTVNEAKILQLLEDFQQSYPHIHVQTISLPFEDYYNATKKLINHDMLDVMTMNFNNFRQYVEHDDIDTLEPFAVNEEVYSFTSAPFIFEGKQYVQPLIHSPVVLCYNVNHFRENNLPEPDSSWTWKKLISVAEKLTDNVEPRKRYGFYFHPLSPNRWPIFLLQNGSRFNRDNSGKYQISSTPIADGLRICRDLIQRHDVFPLYLSESESDAEALFLQEKVSMIMTTYFNLNHLREATFPFEISPLPYQKKPATLLIVIGVAVNRHSKQKKAALTLVDFLLSRQSQMTIRQETYSIPSVKTVAECSMEKDEAKLYRPTRYNLYREIIPTFCHFTDLNISHDDLNTLNQELKFFWSGMEDEKHFCRRMENLL